MLKVKRVQHLSGIPSSGTLKVKRVQHLSGIPSSGTLKVKRAQKMSFVIIVKIQVFLPQT
jgi:hypothetical protein